MTVFVTLNSCVRHPELVSGSGCINRNLKKMLKQVQHDVSSNVTLNLFSRHPELVSGSQYQRKMLKRVQHDETQQIFIFARIQKRKTCPGH